MTDEEKSKPTTWVISGPTYNYGKRRSGPKTGKLLINNDRDHQKFLDSYYDEVIEDVRSCINKPDADLNHELFMLKTAWFGKGHYRDYVAKNRKELRRLKKQIKKHEFNCHISKPQMAPPGFRHFHFPPVCSVIDELSAEPKKLKPKITIAHIEKLVRTAKTVSDLQPALELLYAARTALDEIEKQKEADFKRAAVEIKKLRVQIQKKIDEKAASKAAEVPNEEGTSKAAEVPNQQENEA